MEEKKSDKTEDLWVIRKMEITAIKFMKPEVRKVMTIMLLQRMPTSSAVYDDEFLSVKFFIKSLIARS